MDGWVGTHVMWLRSESYRSTFWLWWYRILFCSIWSTILWCRLVWDSKHRRVAIDVYYWGRYRWAVVSETEMWLDIFWSCLSWSCSKKETLSWSIIWHITSNFCSLISSYILWCIFSSAIVTWLPSVLKCCWMLTLSPVVPRAIERERKTDRQRER